MSLREAFSGENLLRQPERPGEKSYRIFPPIGIARVGNSPTDFYLGAESPQLNFLPRGGYRDARRRVKRMGQRFRIYEFEGEKAVREITIEDARIEWTVRLINSKAASGINPSIPAKNLTIDTRRQSVSGKNRDKAVSGELRPLGVAIPVKLGNLRTDELGRLIVLGGHGRSDSWDGSPPDSLFNPGWFDDASDGTVDARIWLPGRLHPVAATGAWVIVGPADFSHPTRAIVTLYDLAENAARTFVPGRRWKPSFTRDIYPVLQRAVFMQWTSSQARWGHGAGFGDFLAPANFAALHELANPGGKAAREAVFNRLRDPNDPFGSGNMPQLAGGLSLTELQYNYFEQWKDGFFTDDWNPSWNPSAPPEPALEKFPIEQQPHQLTQAALGAGVGGSFSPGIETGGIFASHQSYEAPFRISHALKPGDLTQSLSVPWQADFNACSEYWWPSARPGSVIVENGGVFAPDDWARGIDSNQNMVDNWAKLGFVARQSENPLRYTEQERTLP
jgi:hypothetical protein